MDNYLFVFSFLLTVIKSMKYFYSILTGFIWLFFLIPDHAAGQKEPGGLYLTGKVTTEQGSVNGAVIRMTRNGQPMKDYQVLPDGKFDLRFEFNNDYVLIFTRSDNFPQKLVISTMVPAEVLRVDRKFPPFPVNINLFTEVKGIDRTFAENAIMKIYYSPSVDNFIPEVYYNNPQIKKLIDQAIWQSQNVSRESDLLKRLTAAELAELKKEYDELLRKAGGEFDSGKYFDALNDYKAASRIFPSEQYPRDRIAEINDLIAVLGLQAELDSRQAEKYNQFIGEGDRQFTAAKYAGARENYSQALLIRQGDAYATGRIAEIDRIMADRQKQEQYAGIIAKADQAFKEKNWEQAKSSYLEAGRMKPDEAYPKSQIALIDKELENIARNTEKEANFKAAVLNGDVNYGKKLYAKAIAFYETALTYKPGDAEVMAKIAKIEQEQRQIANKLFYDETIVSADKAFNKKEYLSARELYTTALTAWPEQSYPQKQIDAIDAILQKSAAYNQLIVQGDSAFGKQDYKAARGKFTAALVVKPGEPYPEGRIREIDAIEAREAKADQEYRTLIAGADKLFGEQKWPQARDEYRKAAGIRPADPYPPMKLSEISEIEAEQARLQAEKENAEKARLLAETERRELAYKKLVDEADRLAGQTKLVEAVGKFREALEVKPQESYPLQRIEEIRGIIARQTEAQKAYEAAITKGDKEFSQQQYGAARNSFQQALAAKKEEPYPAEMIARIDSIESEQSRLAAEKLAAEQAAREAAEAEKARIEAERLAKAEAERQAAEAEKARLAEEKARLAAEKAAKEEAAKAAAEAERQRLAEEKARLEAERLARLEAEREAAEAEKARLAAERAEREEAARLAALAEKDKRYTEAVARGDQSFGSKKYTEAIDHYRSALREKPEEGYPQQKITECQSLLAEMAANQKAYDEAVAAGDREFRRQAYPAAREAFLRAQQAKSEERYPREMIARIDALMTEQSRIAEEKAKQEAERVARIEAERQAAEAEKARLAAEKAAKEEAAKAAAEAERQRLAEEKARLEAERLARLEAEREAEEAKKARLAEEKARMEAERLAREEADRKAAEEEQARIEAENLNKAYTRLILSADKALENRELTVAASNYREALVLKPAEVYPKNRLASIDSLNQALQTEEKYRAFLLAADASFRTSQWSPAREAYSKALEIKPNESYPKEQIGKIDEILLLQEQRKAVQPEIVQKEEIAPQVTKGVVTDDTEVRYNDMIATANQAFADKEYNVSRAWYYQALALKPQAPYPAGRIEEIRQIIQSLQLSRLDREFQQYIDKGDEAFRNNELAVARSWYNRSLNIKPDDNYPKSQIMEIQLKIAEQMEGNKDKLFNDYISQGDQAFALKNYTIARVWYQRALLMKPSDPMLHGKLEQVTKALAGQGKQ